MDALADHAVGQHVSAGAGGLGFYRLDAGGVDHGDELQQVGDLLRRRGVLEFEPDVVSSGMVQPFTKAIVAKTFLPRLGSAAFSSVAATALAVSLLPLWNFTSFRSVTVTEVPSGAMSQAVARLGTGFPSGVYSIRLS